jgi:lysophospholipase L1-like esterase
VKSVLIGIANPDERALVNPPGWLEAVEHYNGILAAVADEFSPTAVFIDALRPEAPESRLYVSDGYHLSPEGHAVLASAIAEVCPDSPSE